MERYRRIDQTRPSGTRICETRPNGGKVQRNLKRNGENMNLQISNALTLLHHHLGDNLLAVHLFGSAVSGGLKPASDIDLLVTVRTPLSDSIRKALMTDLLRLSAWPATAHLRPLEVTLLVHDAVRPWRYRPMRELQFGEWLRDELQAGRFEPAMADHDLAILLSKARQHAISLLGPPAAELFEPVPEADMIHALHDTAAQWNGPDDWLGDECNVVLALARIWLTLSSGEIAAKDVAADWLLERLPPEHRPLLETARDVYLGQARDDLAQRPQALAAFIGYARRQIERLRSESANR
uniref:Aminoglycoside (3'') (9) adenylyltransferase n=1 Tax=Ectopseudomonas mendocina (strain ymp) TaxID=399739 RepID=A4XUC2_ECTM1